MIANLVSVRDDCKKLDDKGTRSVSINAAASMNNSLTMLIIDLHAGADFNLKLAVASVEITDVTTVEPALLDGASFLAGGPLAFGFCAVSIGGNPAPS